MSKLSYEEAATRFKLALNEFGIAHRQTWKDRYDEAAAEKSDAARLRCVKLYCDLLTKLEEAGIEP